MARHKLEFIRGFRKQKKRRGRKMPAAKKLQDEFVEQICDRIDYWHDLPGKTIRERIEGAVFSALVMLDGGCPCVPPFAVKPIDEDGYEGEDIAGYLHELFCQKSKKRGTA